MSVSASATTTKWQMVFPGEKKPIPKLQLAQLNIARAMYPLDDARMEGFVSRLDEINALAESSDGFIWRLKTESGNAVDIPVSDNSQEIVNLSVWESVDQLFKFTYQSAHKHVMAMRKEWFTRLPGAHQVLWWVEAGHHPGVEEALGKLKLLDREGPGPEAFTFKNVYEPD